MNLQKSFGRLALLLLLSLSFGRAIDADDGIDRRSLFATNVKGCVGIMTSGGPASGWVVDIDKRWIVTCQHVVGTKSEIEVVFPTFQEGKLLQDRSYYVKTAARTQAKVLSVDPKRDLCLMQVDVFPVGTTALRLASDSGQPGENLNLIGNPAASGAMWNFSIGTLRAVYRKRFIYKNTSHEVDAVIGETQLPANPGDSGGAVFNDRGEVMGVHSGGTPDGIQLMATYIDISEVRAFLREPFKIVATASSFDDYFSAGNDFFHRNEMDKAIEAYSKAVKLKPDHSEAWRSRASAYIRKKQYEKAIEDCNQALTTNRANAKAYNERAVCYGARSDFKAALADYNEAVRLDPKDPLHWAARAWTLNALKEHQKAISDADEAIRIKSDYAFAFRERGLAHASLKEYEKALTDLNQAINLESNNSESHYYRGVSLAALNKSSDAMKEFNEAIRLNPKYALALKDRGTLQFNNKQYQPAIKDYTDAISINAKDAQAFLYRSWCHQNLGNRDQAEADMRRALELDPTIGRGRGGD